MRSFIKKTVKFLFPVLIILGVLEFLLQCIPNDYKLKRTYIESHSEEIEVLVLGNSHSFRGLNPEHIDKKAFNASYVSQTIDYDYQILNKYISNLNNLKCVVLSISYSSLFSQLQFNQESWRIKNYNLYYGIMNYSKVKYFSELLSNSTQVSLRKLLDYYFYNVNNITSTEKGFGSKQIENSTDFKELGKLAAIRHTKNLKLFPENLIYLQKLINLTKNNNVKLILFTPPSCKEYYNFINNHQLNKTVTNLDSLDNIYEHVDYLDYLKDSSFKKNDFYNPDHLNTKGSEKLTKKINLIIENK